jgi:hypothetical protein
MAASFPSIGTARQLARSLGSLLAVSAGASATVELAPFRLVLRLPGPDDSAAPVAETSRVRQLSPQSPPSPGLKPKCSMLRVVGGLEVVAQVAASPASIPTRSRPGAPGVRRLAKRLGTNRSNATELD